MMKVVLVFPGQGSQYVGMGLTLKDQSLFDQANSVLGYDLKNLCLNGPMEELTLTKNTQPAILTHSISLLNKLKQEFSNLKIETVLGHSVGEYAALVAAKVLTFEEAVKAVNLRGNYMQEATPQGVGAMMAIIKVPAETVSRACHEASTEDNQVMVANYNDPNQTVISGHKEACERAVDWLKSNYEKSFRAIPLKVSAPFHSSLMKPAEEKLSAHFENVHFSPNEVPVITNIDAKKNAVQTEGSFFKEKLVKQVSGSVMWKQSIEKLDAGSLIIEVGPGKVLKGLISKTRSDLKIISLDQEKAFDELKELL